MARYDVKYSPVKKAMEGIPRATNAVKNKYFEAAVLFIQVIFIVAVGYSLIKEYLLDN